MRVYAPGVYHPPFRSPPWLTGKAGMMLGTAGLTFLLPSLCVECFLSFSSWRCLSVTLGDMQFDTNHFPHPAQKTFAICSDHFAILASITWRSHDHSLHDYDILVLPSRGELLVQGIKNLLCSPFNVLVDLRSFVSCFCHRCVCTGQNCRGIDRAGGKSLLSIRR